MSNPARLQDPHAYTVQICHPASGEPLGLGVVVAPGGQVVTCAAVVAGLPADGTALLVLPHLPPAQRTHHGQVVARHACGLVLLHSRNGPLLAPEQQAVLGAAAAAERHACRVFSSLPTPALVSGTVEGFIAPTSAPDAQPTRVRVRVDVATAHAPFVGGAVLADEYNLVVGIVCPPDTPAATEDASAQYWHALDAAVLAEPPFALPVRTAPLPLLSAPRPPAAIDAHAVRELAVQRPDSELFGSPPVPDVPGHAALRQVLSANWHAPDVRVVCVRGALGSGTSSLVRAWANSVLSERAAHAPDAVFWWNFQANPNVDAFLEATLLQMTHGKLDMQLYPSSRTRMELLGHLIAERYGAAASGRLLLVLDGLDTVQAADGPQQGRLHDPHLRALLHWLAAPGQRVGCVITSQFATVDLLSWVTYREHALAPLSGPDGHALLAGLGFVGDADAAALLQADTQGHTLLLRLLGAHLAAPRPEMEDAPALVLPVAPAGLSDAAQVQHTLHALLGALPLAEYAVLVLLSLFRRPVDEAALAQLLSPPRRLRMPLRRPPPNPLLAPLADLDTDERLALLDRMVTYGLVMQTSQGYGAHYYSLHPLLRAAVRATLPADAPALAALHERSAHYYLGLAGRLPRFVNLADLEPLIEAVYHTCQAGQPDAAWQIAQERIEQGERLVLRQLALHATQVDLLRAFLPAADLAAPPLVHDIATQAEMSELLVSSLLSLHQTSDALDVYTAHDERLVEAAAWPRVMVSSRTLAQLFLLVGPLDVSTLYARAALAAARHTGSPASELAALVLYAWVEHVRGYAEGAQESFAQVEALRASAPDELELFSQDAIWYADYLRQTGAPDQARALTEATLARARAADWQRPQSLCLRVLADLAAAAGEADHATRQYTQAVKQARAVDHPPTLIEALLARGRWRASQGQPLAQLVGLAEALDLAQAGGYRLYEAAIRRVRAQALQAADPQAATHETHYAAHLEALIGVGTQDGPPAG